MKFGKIVLSRITITLIITAWVLILLNTYIEQKIHKTFIFKLLCKTESNYFIDAIFIFLFFYWIYLIIKKIKFKPIISLNQILISLIIIVFYLYYRIFDSLNFKSFYLSKDIKYFDCVFFYFLIPFVLVPLKFFRSKRELIDVTSIPLLADTAVNGDNDLLDRKYKANRLYHEICSTRGEESIAIGITGEWGSGKTSFLKMIKNEFENNKSFVQIDFNPWLNLSIESIVKDFFNTLESSLENYSVDISRELKKYSDLIININKSSFIESLAKETGIIEETNLTKEFKYINELLKKIDKRIIIHIDDFDRLQANEIFEILKIIRNTAGFDTFVYIVAYDKTYLVESLKINNIPNPQSFSEKIFLKEERLLPVTNLQINEFLKVELLKTFNHHSEKINNFFNNNAIVFDTLDIGGTINLPLKNLRDAKRFYNSFANDYLKIEQEVIFEDYFYLKLLKYKFYDIYVLLFLYKDKFLKLDDNARSISNKRLLSLRSDKTGTFYSRVKLEETVLGIYLERNLNIYSSNELDILNDILNKLFVRFHPSSVHHLSIVFPSNFYNYFRDNIDENSISDLDFNNTLQFSLDKLKAKVVEWNIQGKLSTLKYKFYDLKLKEFNSKDEYENFIKIILFIANLEDSKLAYYGNGYDATDLKYRILNVHNRISEKCYDSNLEELRKFLLNVFQEAKSPNYYESDFMKFLSDEYPDDDIVLSNEEMKGLLVKYLKDYVSGLTKADKVFWKLYHNCNVLDWSEPSNAKERFYIPEAQDILKSLMLRDLDTFLVDFIQPQSFYKENTEDNKIGIGNGVRDNIFGSFDNFYEFIKKDGFPESLLKPSEFLDEFSEFLEKCKENDFGLVTFDFKYLPVLEKIQRYSK